MAVAAGDILSFHDDNEFTVVRSAADTGGEVLELEMFFPPTTEDVPRHIHPEQAETYEVIEGAFKVLVGSEWRELGPGESATVPAGTVHTFRVVGDEPARVRNLHAPALDFEDYFATESRLMREGRIKSYSSPVALLYYAGLLGQYRHCMVMASPAVRVVIADRPHAAGSQPVAPGGSSPRARAVGRGICEPIWSSQRPERFTDPRYPRARRRPS